MELFAGYGGLGLAVQHSMKARLAGYAEVDPAASHILNQHFPGVPNLGDVTTADWGNLDHIDIISGGSPCQDISISGKRTGMITGNRSGLWASIRDAIAHYEPSYVIWENVRAATSSKASSLNDPTGQFGLLRALGRVLGDLTELGYDAEWRLIRASDVGACHQRARIFLLAWKQSLQSSFPDQKSLAHWNKGKDYFSSSGIFKNNIPSSGSLRLGKLYDAPTITSHSRKTKLLPTPTSQMSGNPPDVHLRKKPGRKIVTDLQIILSYGLIPTGGMLPTENMPAGYPYGFNVLSDYSEGWGEYLPRVMLHAEQLGLPVIPDPTVPGKLRPRVNPEFVEWMMGLPHGHVTSPEHKIPLSAQLSILGNGVVPQQASHAITSMVTSAGIQLP